MIPDPSVLLSLESVEKKGKIQKCEYLKNEKSFLDEIKNIFIKNIFEALSFGEKIKVW